MLLCWREKSGGAGEGIVVWFVSKIFLENNGGIMIAVASGSLLVENF